MFGQQPSGGATPIMAGPRSNNSYFPVLGQQPGGQTAQQPPSPMSQWGAPPQAPSGKQQYQSSVAPYQAQKDMAAFGALQNIGVAGLNAMGQYGSNRDTSLANQSIAAANAYGSMGNAYYNTMGQLGNYAAGLGAAGLNAGAQSASASMGGNFNMANGGNFGFGGGGGGFLASGPGGVISSGRGGRGRGGMDAGFNNSGSGSTSTTIQKGSSPWERAAIMNQGYGMLGGLAGELNNPNNQAMSMAKMMGSEFGNNRAAIMDPSIVNSLNNQVGAGYGALGGLYGMSDYGFNTGLQMAAPQFNQVQSQPDYWKNPSAYGAHSWRG